MNKNINEILNLAKSGDCNAKESIINMYLPLIHKKIYTKEIKYYPIEDLFQLGRLAILKCIISFDINKGINAFTSYVSICLENTFIDTLRVSIRESNTSYVSTVDLDTSLIANNSLTPDETNVIDLIITKELSFNLQNCIDNLSVEEKELISALFIKEDSKSLRSYAISRNIPYITALKIRNRSYSKIKNSAYFKFNNK